MLRVFVWLAGIDYLSRRERRESKSYWPRRRPRGLLSLGLLWGKLDFQACTNRGTESFTAVNVDTVAMVWDME
jgi:hypothetical protein